MKKDKIEKEKTQAARQKPDAKKVNFEMAAKELEGYLEELKDYAEDPAGTLSQRSYVLKVKKAGEGYIKERVPRQETRDKPRNAQEEEKPEDEKAGKAAKPSAKEENSEDLPFGDSFENYDVDEEPDPEPHHPSGESFGLAVSSRREKPSPERFVRYAQPDPALPVLSAEAAEIALNAMKELEELKKNFRPFIVVYTNDNGERNIARYLSAENAEAAMQREMVRYMREITDYDESREVYVDDGEIGNNIYEPTPLDHLNNDGTFKTDIEIEHPEHVYKDENHAIVYSEKLDQTARWDIFDLERAKAGDKMSDLSFLTNPNKNSSAS